MAITDAQRTLLNTAFRPHSPIEDPSSFVGRQKDLERVKDGIDLTGQQVVIFGERGAGKTSLANVATYNRQRIQVFCEENANFTTLAKHIVLEYQKIAPQRIAYDAVHDRVTVEGTVLPLGDLDGNSLRRILPQKEKICVILDELDRLKDKSVIKHLGELAKNISTYQSNITLIFVGVAETTANLLLGHQSNFRNLKEVPLDRMSVPELNGIIDHGEKVLSLKFNQTARNKIVEISDRLPYYIHLVATNAAKAALEANKIDVEEGEILRAVEYSAQDADSLLRDAYDHAILSVKRSQLYRQCIWALAKLPNTSHTVSEIAAGANEIASIENNNTVTVQAVGQALKTLASARKNSIVTAKIAGIYAFSHPLMKGYVKLISNNK